MRINKSHIIMHNCIPFLKSSRTKNEKKNKKINKKVGGGRRRKDEKKKN